MESYEDNKDIENGILLTIEDAAAMLGVPVSRIRDWASTGKLPSLSLSPRGEPQFRMGDVIEFLMERIKAAPESEWPGPQGDNKKKRCEPELKSPDSVLDVSVNVGMGSVRAELVPLVYEKSDVPFVP